MSVPLIRSPDSFADVEEIFQHFIDVHTPATAIKFGKATTNTLGFLAEFPEAGSPWESDEPRMQGVRFQNVQGFRNYLIFYRLIQEGLLVMRIVDGRRDLEQIL